MTAVGPVNFPWISQTPSVNFLWSLAHFKNSTVKSRIFSRELGWSLVTRYAIWLLCLLSTLGACGSCGAWVPVRFRATVMKWWCAIPLASRVWCVMFSVYHCHFQCFVVTVCHHNHMSIVPWGELEELVLLLMPGGSWQRTPAMPATPACI